MEPKEVNKKDIAIPGIRQRHAKAERHAGQLAQQTAARQNYATI